MTNEEKRIVTALRCCPDTHFRCEQCPVHDPERPCQNELEAADLIESLSEQNYELLQNVKQLEKQLEQVTRERDAAVDELLFRLEDDGK